MFLYTFKRCLILFLVGVASFAFLADVWASGPDPIFKPCYGSKDPDKYMTDALIKDDTLIQKYKEDHLDAAGLSPAEVSQLIWQEYLEVFNEQTKSVNYVEAPKVYKVDSAADKFYFISGKIDGLAEKNVIKLGFSFVDDRIFQDKKYQNKDAGMDEMGCAFIDGSLSFDVTGKLLKIEVKDYYDDDESYTPTAEEAVNASCKIDYATGRYLCKLKEGMLLGKYHTWKADATILGRDVVHNGCPAAGTEKTLNLNEDVIFDVSASLVYPTFIYEGKTYSNSCPIYTIDKTRLGNSDHVERFAMGMETDPKKLQEEGEVITEGNPFYNSKCEDDNTPDILCKSEFDRFTETVFEPLPSSDPKCSGKDAGWPDYRCVCSFEKDFKPGEPYFYDTDTFKHWLCSEDPSSSIFLKDSYEMIKLESKDVDGDGKKDNWNERYNVTVTDGIGDQSKLEGFLGTGNFDGVDDTCPWKKNVGFDNDEDGVDDACDSDGDLDDDGCLDDVDINSQDPLVCGAVEPDKEIPAVNEDDCSVNYYSDKPNIKVYDTDGDGVIDNIDSKNCDLDDDNDGIDDDKDNCSIVANPDQLDTDINGIGNACDPDDDEDGIFDEVDNCPLAVNADQKDCDLNKIGDACDAACPVEEVKDTGTSEPGVCEPIGVDDDGDGIDNACDNCEEANADQADEDGDGIGDLCELPNPDNSESDTPVSDDSKAQFVEGCTLVANDGRLGSTPAFTFILMSLFILCIVRLRRKGAGFELPDFSPKDPNLGVCQLGVKI